MKKLYAIAIMLLIVTGAYAQSGKTIYNKYSDSKDVSAVYISPTMFKLIGQLPDLDVEMADGEKMNVAPLVLVITILFLLIVKYLLEKAPVKSIWDPAETLMVPFLLASK